MASRVSRRSADIQVAGVIQSREIVGDRQCFSSLQQQRRVEGVRGWREQRPQAALEGRSDGWHACGHAAVESDEDRRLSVRAPGAAGPTPRRAGHRRGGCRRGHRRDTSNCSFRMTKFAAPYSAGPKSGDSPVSASDRELLLRSRRRRSPSNATGIMSRDALDDGLGDLVGFDRGVDSLDHLDERLAAVQPGHPGALAAVLQAGSKGEIVVQRGCRAVRPGSRSLRGHTRRSTC